MVGYEPAAMLSHPSDPALLCPPATGPGVGQRRALIALSLLILALAAAARIYQLDKPLWLDELHTSWAARGTWNEVGDRARDGNQPPVYFWLCHVVTGGTGGGEALLRLPSLLASLLVLPAAWWLVGRLIGKWTAGLVAGYLLAIDPLQIIYGQEARVYALVQLVALLHVGVFALATVDARWPRRLALVLLTVLLFYLHYTSLLVLTGEVAWYVLARRWKPAADRPGTAYTPWKLAIDLAVALACTAPGWDALGDIYGRRDAWRQVIGQVRVAQLFTQFNWLAIVAPASVAAVVAWFIGRRYLREGDQSHSDESTPAELSRPAWVALLACWFFVPLLLVWTATAAGLLSLMLPRYLLIIAPVPAIAAGWLTMLPRRRSLRIAVALATCAWVTLQTAWPYGYLREDWRAAIRWIEAQERAAADPSPVVLWAALVEGGDRQRLQSDPRFRDYLLFPLQGYYRFERTRPLEPLANEAADELSPGSLLDDQCDLIRRHGSAWIVYRAGRSDISDNVEAIREQLAAPGETWQAHSTPLGLLVVVQLTKAAD